MADDFLQSDKKAFKRSQKEDLKETLISPLCLDRINNLEKRTSPNAIKWKITPSKRIQDLIKDNPKKKANLEQVNLNTISRDLFGYTRAFVRCKLENHENLCSQKSQSPVDSRKNIRESSDGLLLELAEKFEYAQSYNLQATSDSDFGIYEDDYEWNAIDFKSIEKIEENYNENNNENKITKEPYNDNELEAIDYDVFLDSDFDDYPYKELKLCGRFLIKSFQQTNNLELKVVHIIDGFTATVLLVDEWADTPVREQYKINLETNKIQNGKYIVDRDGLVVLHPDIYISATNIADSLSCARKSVMQERLKGAYAPTEVLLKGTILHETIQSALSSRDFSIENLKYLVNKAIMNHCKELYILDQPKIASRIEGELFEKLIKVSIWGEQYFTDELSFNNFINDPHSLEKKPRMKILDVLAIEKEIHSTRYGLKGVLDTILTVKLFNNNGESVITQPLEIKTGKFANSISHRAQLSIYILLMAEFHSNCNSGMLYYSETGETTLIRPKKSDLNCLIAKRNFLASFIRDKTLPEMKQSAYSCKNCYALESCVLLNRGCEDGDAESSQIKELYHSLSDHLDQQSKEFVKHWCSLLIREELYARDQLGEMWDISEEERETRGKCLLNMQIQKVLQISKSAYRYYFCKTDSSGIDSCNFSAGDSVLISDQSRGGLLCRGRVISIRKERIIVECKTLVSLQITKGLDIEDLMIKKKQKDLYRIDFDTFVHSMSALHGNIIGLCSKSSCPRKRELIIKNQAPNFSQDFVEVDHEKNLNIAQVRAIEKVMVCQDYTLILGMPGTGKTTTIASLVCGLAQEGYSIILSAYTHSALDNIIIKLLDKDIKLLRIGDTDRIHPKVRHLAISNFESKIENLEELKLLYDSARIVATTCLSIFHPILKKKRDFCIVDEASQMTLPACLGPILLANKFVLVGDHNQLPPLVQCDEVAKNGLDQSLFMKLSRANPQAVVNLNTQYRMNMKIMSLCNKFIYNGELKCGSNAIANAVLSLNSPSANFKECTWNKCWTIKVCNPLYPVTFLNTDALGFTEVKEGEHVVNLNEVLLIKHCVSYFLGCGVVESDIGIVTFYRSQLQLLNKHLGQLEVNTVDKYQGRDKKVIFLSLVRSNNEQRLGDLLIEQRRINVALTRAKVKLVIVGSCFTIQSNKLFFDLNTYLETEGWIWNCPSNVWNCHGRDIEIKSSKNCSPFNHRPFK